MNTLDARVALYAPVLAEAFAAHGLPISWGLALAATESDFRADVVNNSEGDKRRGGSYGLCQMSLQTAREFAPQCTPEDLLEPHKNAAIAAMLYARLARRYKDLSDVASAYNSGQPLVKAPASTRNNYVPKMLKNVKLYAAQAAAMEREALCR